MFVAKRGQAGNVFVIVVGIILAVIGILSIAYPITKSSIASANVSTTDPEFQIVRYLPLMVILVLFLLVVGYLFLRSK